jgi:uncharacterized membrane protein
MPRTTDARSGRTKQEGADTSRLGAFSDAVIAVIITIMVLELRPPEAPTLEALLRLWPTVISYVVSYVFIAIIWVNHHHLLRLVQRVTPRLIWQNFVHLFVVSLLPFATSWIAQSRLAPTPMAVYAAIFVLVDLAYLVFEREVLAQADAVAMPERSQRLARRRTLVALAIFVGATIAAPFIPWLGFGLICAALILYLRPEALARPG